MDLRPVFYVIGILLSTLAISMVLPLLVDLGSGNPDWKVFFFCAMFTLFFGGALIVTNTGFNFEMTVRQAFLLTGASWIVLAAFAALPFLMSDLKMSLTDSVFEAVSGITTTGSTVITGLDHAPPGILLWRAILQWLGGIGIILMAMSVMPFLKVGGMQLFQIELSENEKALPRLENMARTIGIIYVVLTATCALLFSLFGMTKFEALIHAMTTISTGVFYIRLLYGLFQLRPDRGRLYPIHDSGMPALYPLCEGCARQCPAPPDRLSGQVVFVHSLDQHPHLGTLFINPSCFAFWRSP